MKQNYESGRSMVEMLGTLAIIGVLSVGAIVGYSYAMDKYRANQTINELTIRAMGLQDQVRKGEIAELNMELGDKTKLGYTVDAWIDEGDPRYFYIALVDIPSDICRQILKTKWTLPTKIYGIAPPDEWEKPDLEVCGSGEITKQMDFEFYRDFAKIGTGDGGEIETLAPLDACSDPDFPLQGVDGKCYACSESKSVMVGPRGKCQSVCPDRRMVPNSERCILACGVGDDADKPVMDYMGMCHSCFDEDDRIWLGSDADEADCRRVCPNRILSREGGYCHIPCGEGFFTGVYGDCWSCSEPNIVGVGEGSPCAEECDGKRYVKDKFCYFICSGDTPLKNRVGTCYSCSYQYPVDVGVDGQCEEVCGEKRYKDDSGYCRLK